ncbi:MAG: acetate--CoA ligase family protein [Alphaproteobacteria bacterium]|jgi:acetate---CoA ligase (ADP-forming)|nr:acetate--CoA ligase family protein [Alphaproteobacteria bacterium]MBT4019074.1 acetate--CoA ligase family protein [Alphaproteobacteria bacterium]MBT4966473.1 acetate--CoA ligase family protein [Alphaproteobacteria bacterium]MBT5159092.1 acetate--CoA ligase family protein [Alphaproteobacteria bacterium]MBT5918836.1 acetate--CoA ligase family protein [Alphaproteobacteria bacterium]
MTDTSITTLEQMLSPRSVAIVGASDNPGRIGGRPLAYLIDHKFTGDIYPVNPTRDTVQGLKAWPSILDIDGHIDTVVIAVPAPHVVQTVRDCVTKGVKGCIILSAGFAEMGEEGAQAQEELTKISKETGIRLLGPNCLGSMNVHENFLPTFSGAPSLQLPIKGGLSIITQSGAFGAHLYYLSTQTRLGVRYVITTGNESDVQVADAILMCANDPETKVIMAYSEGIKNGDRLIEALEAAAAAEKPVVFMKVGRSEVGALAATSHTASLTGEDAVIDAIFRQYGVHRAVTTEDLVDIAYAAIKGRKPTGRRLGLVTISGGVGVLMADAAEDCGLDVAPMPAKAQASLTDLIPFAAPRNPVDVTAQILNELDKLPQFFSTLIVEGKYDTVLAFFTSGASTKTSAAKFLAAIQQMRQEHPEQFIVLSLLANEDEVKSYEELGFPVFPDASRAVAAIAAVIRFVEAHDRLASREQLTLPDARGLPEGPLSEAGAKKILQQAGLPVLAETLATSAQEAARAAGDKPVAMKIVSPDVLHKTEIGGVLLNVTGADDVAAAYTTLEGRLRTHHPDAQFDGILVSPMIEGGVEIIMGTSQDPVFGPIVMVGLGGVLVEVLKDVSFRKAPFDIADAHMMINELRGSAILDGVRGAAPADRQALASALSQLSLFAAAEKDSIESIDINPFVVFEEGQGAVALDALIVARKA